MKAKTLILFIFLLSLFAAIVAQAQDTVYYKSKVSPFDRNYIKFSPFALLEIEPTIQLGYEYNAGKLRLQHEIGYTSLFNPTYALFTFDQSMQNISSAGAKLRTTLKFTLTPDNNYSRHKYKYFGVDFMFKYLNVKYHDFNVRMMDSYWQMTDISTNKYVGAVHLIYGTNSYLRYANNIITDFYMGIGVRYKTITNDFPSNSNDSFDLYPWWDDIDGLMLSVVLGLKLGFGI